MVDTYSPLYLQSHGNQVKSLVTGKNENIAPIFKKSRKEDARDSWPISLTFGISTLPRNW